MWILDIRWQCLCFPWLPYNKKRHHFSGFNIWSTIFVIILCTSYMIIWFMVFLYGRRSVTCQWASSSGSLPMQWQRVHRAADTIPSAVVQVTTWAPPCSTPFSMVPSHRVKVVYFLLLKVFPCRRASWQDVTLTQINSVLYYVKLWRMSRYSGECSMGSCLSGC